MITLFWLSSIPFAIMLGSSHPVFGLRRYEKPSCEFFTPNYTLEWAFEPLSRSVVFVLRAEFQDVRDSLWTGVGFEDRNNVSIIDFIGVFVKDNGAQTGITDTHINANTGQFAPDNSTNVQTISIAVSNAAGSTGTQVTAKFARAINSKDTQEDVDLSGCTIFNVPLQPMPSVDYSQQEAGKYLNSLKKISVCDIEKHCTVDIRELKLKGSAEVIKKSAAVEAAPQLAKQEAKNDQPMPSNSELQTSPSVEVAHSVDISGKGDPCSFVGPTYTLNWSYNKASDCVDFVLKHAVKKGKWWSTVGIGDNMSDMDIGVLFLEDGKVNKMIDYYSSSYGPPEEDADQNWVLHTSKSKLSGDQLELHFSRVINSPDTEKDRSMDGCVLFQFGANIGKYGVTGSKYAIRKHEEWPDLYKACDLKNKCPQEKHHHSKRERDGLEVGQSVDEASSTNTNNSTTLLQPPNVVEGNTKELEGPQASVENDGIVALLSQEVTTTASTSITSTDSTSNQDIIQEEPQTTADVVRSTLTTLLPNSTDGDADFSLSFFSSNISSSPQASNTTQSTAPLSSVSPLPQSTSDKSPQLISSTASNETQDESKAIQPTLLSLFGEFSTTELFSPFTEASSTTAEPVPSATANGVWSFLHLSTVNGNESNSSSSTTSSSPPPSTTSSTSTIESTTSQVLSDWTSTLAAAAALEIKNGSSSPTESQTSSSTTSPATTSKLQTSTSLASSPTSTSTTTLSPTSSTTTITSSSTNPVTVTAAKVSQEPKPEGCQLLKPDLDVCKSYMTTYFAQVQNWADKHQEPMANQFGKACKLLSAVPHVPTLCCQIFKIKCSTHL